MSRVCLAAAVLALLLAPAVLAEDDCTVTDPATGNFYDLSALTRTGRQSDWIALDSSENNKYNYRINICHDLLYKGYNASVQIPAGTGVHQENALAPMREHVAGKTSFHPSFSDGLLTMTFPDGEICESITENRRSVITFECSASGGLGQPVLLFEDRCLYVFVWKSSAACPVTGLTGFAIFLIILASLIGAYFIFGFLFMRYARNARGWEQIPNYEMWRGVFLALKCSSGGSSRGKYNPVTPDDDGGNLIDNLDDDFDDDAVEKA